MREFRFVFHERRISYAKLSFFNRFYWLPCGFIFKKFTGTKKHHCRWYIKIAFSWMFFTFKWFITTNKIPKIHEPKK